MTSGQHSASGVAADLKGFGLKSFDALKNPWNSKEPSLCGVCLSALSTRNQNRKAGVLAQWCLSIRHKAPSSGLSTLSRYSGRQNVQSINSL